MAVDWPALLTPHCLVRHLIINVSRAACAPGLCDIRQQGMRGWILAAPNSALRQRLKI
jgi:hypothetical protein